VSAAAPGPAASATTSGQKAPAAAPSQPAPAYRSVADLCATVDLTPLTELYPRRGRADHTRSSMTMSCKITLQSDSVLGMLSLDVTLLRDADTAKQMFESARTARKVSLPVEVSDLGTAAYTRLDPNLGTELVAYDGNLYIGALWGDLRDPMKTAPDIVDRLTALCRSTIARLKN